MNRICLRFGRGFFSSLSLSFDATRRVCERLFFDWTGRIYFDADVNLSVSRSLLLSREQIMVFIAIGDLSKMETKSFR